MKTPVPIEQFIPIDRMTVLGRNLLAITASLGLLCGCDTPQANRKAWEYKVVEQDLYPGQLERQINELTSSGWSLVTVTTASQGENAVPKGFIIVRRHKPG